MQPLHSPSPHIQAFRDGSIGWLIINRPARRNALNAEMWAAIPPVIKTLDDIADVRVIVIRGAGVDAFSAGADISEFGETRHDAAAAAEYETLNGEAFAAIRAARKPTVAMIQGFCFGGGLAIALACDFRVADGSAQLSLPPARLGLAYPLDGLRDLVAAVGAAAAKDMLFTAKRLKAHEALRIGLIDHAFADIEPETRDLCTAIAEGAPLTITHAKRAIDLIAGRPGHLAEGDIAALASGCFDSADYAEGRAAFAEKRKPRFEGH
jgi:enoyl-CoA hydratase/carnithine racemase